jgi:hypothetical protein
LLTKHGYQGETISKDFISSLIEANNYDEDGDDGNDDGITKTIKTATIAFIPAIKATCVSGYTYCSKSFKVDRRCERWKYYEGDGTFCNIYPFCNFLHRRQANAAVHHRCVIY